MTNSGPPRPPTRPASTRATGTAAPLDRAQRDLEAAGRIRAEVAERLRDGSSRKLQRHGTAPAFEAFQDALDLITRHDVPEPWGALARYRLAHVTLRGAQTRESLRSANALFEAAANAKVLGPWPAIYRLAVLSRLGAPRSALLEAQRAAADAYSHWTKTTHLYGDGTSERDPRLQEDVFALLYLATLSAGLPHEALDGRGANPEASRLTEGQWLVLTGAPVDHTVGVSEDFARDELAAMAAANPWLATLVLPENVSLPGRLTLPGGTETVNLARTAAQILVLLLAGVRGNERLVSTVFGDGEAGSQPNTAFRQAKFRLTRLFGEFREAPELIVPDERGTLRLGAGIGLVAACPESALQRRDPRRARSNAGIPGESVTSR